MTAGLVYRGIPFVWLTKGFQHIITEVFPALGISKAKTGRKGTLNKEKSTYTEWPEGKIKEARGTKRRTDKEKRTWWQGCKRSLTHYCKPHACTYNMQFPWQDRVLCFQIKLLINSQGSSFYFYLGGQKKTNWNILSTLHINGNYLSILHFQIFKVQGCNKMLDYQNLLYSWKNFKAFGINILRYSILKYAQKLAMFTLIQWNAMTFLTYKNIWNKVQT